MREALVRRLIPGHANSVTVSVVEWSVETSVLNQVYGGAGKTSALSLVECDVNIRAKF